MLPEGPTHNPISRGKSTGNNVLIITIYKELLNKKIYKK